MARGHRGNPIADNHSDMMKMNYGLIRVGKEAVDFGRASSNTHDYAAFSLEDPIEEDGTYLTSVTKSEKGQYTHPADFLEGSKSQSITPDTNRRYKTHERALVAGDLIATADARRESGRMKPRPPSTGKYR